MFLFVYCASSKMFAGVPGKGRREHTEPSFIAIASVIQQIRVGRNSFLGPRGRDLSCKFGITILPRLGLRRR